MPACREVLVRSAAAYALQKTSGVSSGLLRGVHVPFPDWVVVCVWLFERRVDIRVVFQGPYCLGPETWYCQVLFRPSPPLSWSATSIFQTSPRFPAGRGPRVTARRRHKSPPVCLRPASGAGRGFRSVIDVLGRTVSSHASRLSRPPVFSSLLPQLISPAFLYFTFASLLLAGAQSERLKKLTLPPPPPPRVRVFRNVCPWSRAVARLGWKGTEICLRATSLPFAAVPLGLPFPFGLYSAP